MAFASQYQKYKAQSVSALTPGEQIVLLFEQAVVSLAKALLYIESKDIPNAHNAIIRAQNIYLFLSDNLDMQFEISHNLYALYQYAYDELIKANMKKDVEIVKRILDMTREFKETWKNAEMQSRLGGIAK